MTNRICEGLESLEVVGVALLLSLSILSCGSDAAGPAQGDAPTPVATTLTPSATVLSFSSLGATEQLTVTVHDQNGAAMSGASVAWASSASSVASVTPTGLVTAVADGTATVTATSGSAAGTVSVTVQQVADPAGGNVSLADGAVNLVFPAGAVSEAVLITGEPATGLPADPVPIPGTAFDFGPDGIVFVEPVTLTIEYDPANVPQDVPEEELRLHKLVGSAYIQVDSGMVDVVNNTVSGSIDGFSVFAILRTLGVTTGSPMPNGTVGVGYSQTLTATGGDGNYTWAMFNSTTLPAGLGLNNATGEISGIPSTEATTNFEVEVTSAGQTATKALAITIGNPAPSVTTSTPMPIGPVGVGYSETLAATGGDGNYTWAMFNSTTLPAGLGLNNATGEISGIPSTEATTNFEVEVTSAGQTATKALAITIGNPAPSVTTSTPMPIGAVGVGYSQTLTATGGDGNYTWAMFNSTTLPAGLGLNNATGEISGIPSTEATTNFEVEVTSAGQTATKALAITIGNPAPSVTTSTPMPIGPVGVGYSETLAATGGDGNYTWAMFNSTTLPAGLGLNNATGEISGIPSTEATTNFEVEVTSAGQTATKALAITIGNPAPSVTTSTPMPIGPVGTLYSETLAATGGDGNYTWAMFNSTTLPAGLGLNNATGEISGIPSTEATTNFEVEVTSAGQTATKALAITIGNPAPSVTTSTPMPIGAVGVGYSETLTATGGDGNYTWAMFNSTTLPAGLGLNNATGEISGTPSAAATTNFEVEVTSAGQTATKALAITVGEPVVSSIEVSPTQVTLLALGTTQQFTAVAKDASGATISGKTFSWSSSVPVVSTIDATSGLATAVENGTTTITATSDGVSGSTALEVEQAAAQVVIVTQPTDAVSGEPISPAVVAEIRDANDNLAKLVVAPVTLAIETNPRGGTLAGITTVSTTGGVATFAGLSIDKPATDYTLLAASGTLASATSEPFSIAQRICTLTPSPRPLAAGQGGPYTVDESRVPDRIGTFAGGHNSLGFMAGFVTADFNNDGLDDLLFTAENLLYNQATGLEAGVPIYILVNDGTGSFVDATSSIIVGEIPAPLSAGKGLAEDFNGDGWTDVFMHQVGLDTGAGTGGLNVLLLSDGFGGLVDSPANIHDVAGLTFGSAAGDVDCDGDIDIYAGNTGPFAPNYLMINDGTGNFAVHEDYLPEFVRFFGDGLHADWGTSSITDLDGDNFPELILGRSTPPPGDAISESVVLWNDGTGNFDFVDYTLLPDRSGWLQSSDVSPIDIDLDGDLDLIIAVSTFDPFTHDIQILINNGDRTFSDETASRISGLSTNAEIISQVQPIDFNSDGAPDLLLQHRNLSSLGYPQLIFLNNGVGVFTPLDNSVLLNRRAIYFPLDADGDGGLDFILYSRSNWLGLMVHQ